MTLSTLEYSEIQKIRKLPITFHKICPYSSGTQEEQKTEKKGLSIVALFSDNDKEQIRTEIIKKIHDLHYVFAPANNLHSTLLTIYPSKNIYPEKPNDYINSIIRDNLQNFFASRRKSITITLNFNEIRPGTWYGLDNSQIPNASNGTLVAVGDPSINDGNEKFVTLANELVCNLKNNLGQIFSDKFDRKFPTVWSTLGYFDQEDFYITQKFADTFYQFKKNYSKNPLKITLDSVWLVEYSFKDLRDANPLLEFPL